MEEKHTGSWERPVKVAEVMNDSKWETSPSTIVIELEELVRQNEVMTKIIHELYDKAGPFLRPPEPIAEAEDPVVKDFSSSELATMIKKSKKQIEENITLLNDFIERLDI